MDRNLNVGSQTPAPVFQPFLQHCFKDKQNSHLNGKFYLLSQF